MSSIVHNEEILHSQFVFILITNKLNLPFPLASKINKANVADREWVLWTPVSKTRAWHETEVENLKNGFFLFAYKQLLKANGHSMEIVSTINPVISRKIRRFPCTCSWPNFYLKFPTTGFSMVFFNSPRLRNPDCTEMFRRLTETLYLSFELSN